MFIKVSFVNIDIVINIEIWLCGMMPLWLISSLIHLPKYYEVGWVFGATHWHRDAKCDYYFILFFAEARYDY